MFLLPRGGIWCWERWVAKIVSCPPVWISCGKTDSLWVCSLFYWYLGWNWGRRAHPNILTIKTVIFSDFFWIVELIMEGWENGLSFLHFITFYKAYMWYMYIYTYANIYVYRYMCVYINLCEVKVTQSCLTLCNPTDCSPPGSSVHGNLQARILVGVAISFSRGSSQPRDWTHISYVSCIDRQVLYH